jgi:hypothetical protein
VSDGNEIDLMKIGTHAVAGGGGATLVGVIMRVLQGRDAREARDEFVSLRGAVQRLIEDVGEHKKVFEDVVETKLSVKALHARLDDTERRLARLEAKKR